MRSVENPDAWGGDRSALRGGLYEFCPDGNETDD